MEKKKSADIALIVLISLLSLIIGLLGGYALFNYIQDNEEISCDNSTEANKIALFQKAAIAMENYYISNDMKYIDSLQDENTKNYLSLSKIFNNIERHDYCKYLDKNSGDYIANDCEHSEHAFFKTYEDALLAKQLLFGENQTIEKKNFEYSEGGVFFNYYYIPELNGFLELIHYGGGGCSDYLQGEKIFDVKEEKGKLKVRTYKYYLKDYSCEENYSYDYELGTSAENLFGIKFNHEDLNEEVVKYIDKLEQYEYVLDDYNTSIGYLNAFDLNKGYTLTEINKIK